jgi:hypothetical protein
MTFLSPLLLLAASAVAVPVLLHFLQRSRGRTVSFPAVRYLQRTAKDHARSIRSRQKLLLFLRILLLTLITLAAARPLLTALSSTHPPTALAIVVDNTMSSGAVQGGVRALDRLKDVARESVARAGAEDRIWLVRVGEPWVPARPLSPERALRDLEEIEPTPFGGSLEDAVERALDLVRAAELEAAEVHVLSDLRRTALEGVEPRESTGGEPPVLVWRDTLAPPPNLSVASLVVGGGLPPLPDERTDFVFSLSASGPWDPSVPVRLFAEDRLRGRVEAEPGAIGAIAAGPFQAGWVTGSVEVDPDALRADDRRYFAFRVRPPVRTTGLGVAGPFMDEALRVLEESGRVLLVGSGGEVAIRTGGVSSLNPGGQAALILLPPGDRTLLPGINRLMDDLDLGWRYDLTDARGQLPLSDSRIPGLSGVEVGGGYRLVPSGGSVGRVMASTSDGAPWLIEVSVPGMRALLVGAPLDPSFTTLPLRAGMVPFVDWMLTRWAGGSAPADEIAAGELLIAPAGVTAVLDPGGSRIDLQRDGGPGGRAVPGVYRFLAGDSLVAAVASNPPPGESDLRPATDDAVSTLAGPEGMVVSSREGWTEASFRIRTGPEAGWVILLLAALLLGLESIVAASAPSGSADPSRRTAAGGPGKGGAA